MRPRHPVGLSLLSVAVVLGPGWSRASGGDSPAELALKEKGLARAGRVFVVEDEKPALARLKEVRSTFAAYAAIAEKQATFERSEAESARLEEQRVELKSHLDDLNQRIIEQAAWQGGNNNNPRQGPGGGAPGGPGSTSPLLQQRNQVQAALNEVTMGQKAVKADAPVVKDKAALDDEVKKQAEAFKAALAELRPMFDKVTKKYADLAADEAVKKSLGDLEKAAKAKVKLGPSDAFLAAGKELAQAEQRFLGKKSSAPAKKAKAKAKARK